MEFRKVKAEEYCDSVRDGTHDSPLKVNEGYKLITSKHIKNNYIDFDNAYNISEEDYIKINQRSLVEKNDILYSMIGTVGLIYRVKEKPEFAIKNIGLFKIKNELKSKWLYYYLKSPKMISYIQTLLTGSTQQYITLKNLRELPIEYPKNEEYTKKIIGVLESIDKKIELNNKINDNLFKIQKSYFRELFKNKKYQKISLDEICGIYAGGDVPQSKSEQKNQYYKIPIISNGISNEGIYGYTNVSKINKKSITISARGTIGYKVLRDYDYYPIVRLISIIPKDNKISAEYLYYALDDIQISGTGTTQQQLTVPMVKRIEIKAYDSKLINQFTEFSLSMNNQITSNKIENEKLEKLKNTLLPKLMNGEVDLDKIEI